MIFEVCILRERVQTFTRKDASAEQSDSDSHVDVWAAGVLAERESGGNSLWIS